MHDALGKNCITKLKVIDQLINKSIPMWHSFPVVIVKVSVKSTVQQKYFKIK
jgi:hypothetical protein